MTEHKTAVERKPALLQKERQVESVMHGAATLSSIRVVDTSCFSTWKLANVHSLGKI